MGSSQRRERERLEMRELILEAAMQLFNEESYEATTMRRIAERIEYTPGAIYGYFKDKSEILFALHTRGFDLLIDYQRRAIADLDDPDDKIEALGQAYLAFGFEHSALYDLMFLDRYTGRTIAEAETWDSGLDAYGILRSVMVDFIGKHDLDLDPDVASYTCWSLVHGMVALQIRQRCVMIPSEQLPKVTELSHRFFVLLLRGDAHERLRFKRVDDESLVKKVKVKAKGSPRPRRRSHPDALG
jgi:AcrR family transcriptional regulator